MLRLPMLCCLVACAGGPVLDGTDRDPDTSGVDTDDDTDTDTDTDADTDTDTDDDTDVGPRPFVDITDQAGFVHSQFERPDPWTSTCFWIEVHGGGGAIGDVDGDGLLDVFLAVYDGRSRLYRNLGGGRFEDRSEDLMLEGGFPSGGTFADVDGDGDLDLAVPYVADGFLDLWINDGTGGFVEEGRIRGLSPPTPEHAACPLNWGAAFADPDEDGDLDLVVGAWGLDLPDRPRNVSRFYLNDGAGRFTDASATIGLEQVTGAQDVAWTFSPLWGDLDGDGDVDLAMTSDFGSNHILRNDGPESWTPLATEIGVDDVENAMGGQLVDVDHDGDLDWLITAISDSRPEVEDVWGTTGNRLYLNDGSGRFVDRARAWGLRDGGWGWGVAAFDPDNDGDLDVGWTNGYFMPDEGSQYLVEPYLDDATAIHVRSGSAEDPQFLEQARSLGVRHTGQGRGFVPFDMDNDGDLDLLIINWADRPALWENVSAAEGRASMTIRVRSPGNVSGIGSRVEVQPTEGGPSMFGTVQANPSYLTGLPAELHFGLGDHVGSVHQVTVLAADGREVVLRDVDPDGLLSVEIR